MIVDTSAYSYYRRGHADAVAVGAAARRLVVCPIVVGELLSGYIHGGRAAENRAHLNAFLAAPHVRVAALTNDVAEEYARLLQEARRIGRPIPTNDAWIAAFAFHQGVPLWTYDSHFDSLPGLRVVRRSSDLRPGDMH